MGICSYTISYVKASLVVEVVIQRPSFVKASVVGKVLTLLTNPHLPKPLLHGGTNSVDLPPSDKASAVWRYQLTPIWQSLCCMEAPALLTGPHLTKPLLYGDTNSIDTPPSVKASAVWRHQLCWLAPSDKASAVWRHQLCWLAPPDKASAVWSHQLYWHTPIWQSLYCMEIPTLLTHPHLSKPLLYWYQLYWQTPIWQSLCCMETYILLTNRLTPICQSLDIKCSSISLLTPDATRHEKCYQTEGKITNMMDSFRPS